MSDLERIESKIDRLLNGEVPKKQRLMTTEQTAVYIGKTPRHVRRFFSKKVKPIQDGKLMWDINDIDRWIENSKR